MLDLALCKAEIFLPSPSSIHEFVVREFYYVTN
jgi:hypothetical protein